MYLKRFLNGLAVLVICWGTIMGQTPPETWTHQYTFPDIYRIRAVTFTDLLQGWAVGSTPGGSGPVGVILHTEDGGNTWTEQVRDTTYSWLNDIIVNPDTMGWAVGLYDCFETRDGGISWNRVPREEFQCGQFTGLGDMQSVALWPPATGVIVGTENIIASTSDGGQTWNCQEFTPPDDWPDDLLWIDTLHTVQFFKADTLFASGMGGIAGTVDGGLHWEMRHTEYLNYHQSAIVAPRFGWVISRISHLLRSRDAGSTWEDLGRVFTDYSIGVRDIAFSDSLLGWICTSDGSIWETTDGGTSWTEREITPGTAFVHVGTVPGRLSYAVNAAGQFYVQHHDIMNIPPEIEDVLPTHVRLSPGYPNPFNGNVTWYYILPSQMHVRMTVYNLEGQKVEQLFAATQSAGRHMVQWIPEQCGSGVYFGVLETESQQQIQRVLYVK